MTIRFDKAEMQKAMKQVKASVKQGKGHEKLQIYKNSKAQKRR